MFWVPRGLLLRSPVPEAGLEAEAQGAARGGGETGGGAAADAERGRLIEGGEREKKKMSSSFHLPMCFYVVVDDDIP